MDENKNLNDLQEVEETEAVAEETVAETEEAVTEVAEEAVEEMVAEEAVSDEEIEAELEEELAAEETEDEATEAEPVKKKGKAGKVIAIVIGAIVALAVIAATVIGALVGFDKFIDKDEESGKWSFKFDEDTKIAITRLFVKNPYNEMGYLNFSGRTIADVAEDAGMTYEEFLAQYSLPADMPRDTIEEAAYNSIPLGVFAQQMYGIDVATFKEAFQLGDDVDENTPYGVAEGKVKLSVAIGEENLEEFKAQYGFGDEITGDTLWSEVRPIIEKKAYDEQMAAKEAEANAEANNEAENADAEQEAEVPALGGEAPEEAE